MLVRLLAPFVALRRLTGISSMLACVVMLRLFVLVRLSRK